MTSTAEGQRQRAPLKLWDVLNAEAHVHALARETLRAWRARLDDDKLEDLIAYLFAECWRISGLGPDGRDRADAFEYLAIVETVFSTPVRSSISGAVWGMVENLGPYPTVDEARVWGERAAAVAREDRVTFEILQQRASGMYDPDRGLAFVTFSRRILSLRVVDWYRDTFGDSRYGRHQIPSSLNALAQAENETVEGYLDKHMPGARDTFVDEWNVHVYDHRVSDEAEASAIAR